MERVARTTKKSNLKRPPKHSSVDSDKRVTFSTMSATQDLHLKVKATGMNTTAETKKRPMSAASSKTKNGAKTAVRRKPSEETKTTEKEEEPPKPELSRMEAARAE